MASAPMLRVLSFAATITQPHLIQYPYYVHLLVTAFNYSVIEVLAGTLEESAYIASNVRCVPSFPYEHRHFYTVDIWVDPTFYFEYRTIMLTPKHMKSLCVLQDVAVWTYDVITRHPTTGVPSGVVVKTTKVLKEDGSFYE